MRVRITGVWAEIFVRDLPNMNKKCHTLETEFGPVVATVDRKEIFYFDHGYTAN
jgi:hypothetical protein